MAAFGALLFLWCAGLSACLRAAASFAASMCLLAFVFDL